MIYMRWSCVQVALSARYDPYPTLCRLCRVVVHSLILLFEFHIYNVIIICGLHICNLRIILCIVGPCSNSGRNIYITCTYRMSVD